ncbi:hypothetical protein FHS60_002111 [Alloprevotella rava]|uniref:Uncharacterized protein n=1 Tax=Alloprevotella rava TaxID=671218 RepID=A0A7W5UKI8_9BACT|nr:hypothetical protein [Alloprevotella rava]
MKVLQKVKEEVLIFIEKGAFPTDRNSTLR